MKTTTSKDGTTIAYEQLGQGPGLILVDGAFCGLNFGPMPALAPLLARNFTVIHYDRRGRGGSGNTAPYAVAREIEDLQALFNVLGGQAFLYGTSSGAALAMRATAAGLGVKRLALYEPPFSLDGTRHPDPADYIQQIERMLQSGNRDGAIKLFMTVVGVPKLVVTIMSLVMRKGWPYLRSVAPTLMNDFAVLGDTQAGGPLPEEWKKVLAAIQTPVLAMAGGKSPPYMHHTMKTVAGLIPGAQTRVIPGQDHNIGEKAIAPVLLEFFGA